MINKFSFRLLGVASFVASFLFAGQAFASGQQISPAYVDYTLEPGDSVEYQLQIKNVDTEPSTMTYTVADFYYNEYGDKVFVEGGEIAVGAENFSLAEWVTVDAPLIFDLEAGEFRNVTVTVTVPPNGEPGGHYGVIFFGGVPADSEAGATQIQVSGRVGSLILIDVPGFIVRDAEIKEFSVGVLEGVSGQEQFAEQSSFESGPIMFKVRYHNLGTTHYFPDGKITVSGGYKKETWELPLQIGQDTDRLRALPRTARDFMVSLNQRKLFGKYTATLEALDGDNDQLKPITIEFWVMPIKTVLLWGLLVIIVVVLLGVLLKRYNRWIGARARAA